MTKVRAQDLVESLLGLLPGQPGRMEASRQRHFYVAVAVNANWLIGELSQFRFGNFQLIARPQQVRGTNLVVALRLRLTRVGRRGNLAGSTYDLEENCRDDRDNFRGNPQSNHAQNHMRVGQISKAEQSVPLPVR